MSKDVQVLVIPLILLVALVSGIYVSQHFSCDVVGYQNLSGSHKENVCKWEN